MSSSLRAAPNGLERPHSHPWTVRTLTPMLSARILADTLQCVGVELLIRHGDSVRTEGNLAAAHAFQVVEIAAVLFCYGGQSLHLVNFSMAATTLRRPRVSRTVRSLLADFSYRLSIQRRLAVSW